MFHPAVASAAHGSVKFLLVILRQVVAAFPPSNGG